MRDAPPRVRVAGLFLLALTVAPYLATIGYGPMFPNLDTFKNLVS